MWYQRLERPNGSFFYVDVNNQLEVTSKDILERIEQLHIPKAYEHVMIHKNPRAKVLAYGYDSRGRKQTMYAPWFVQKQAKKKYAKVLEVDQYMPKLIERVKADIAKHGASRDKVLAIVVYLMIACGFRVGNEKYVTANKSYGLTTLEVRHVRVKPRDATIHIQFTGKKGVDNYGMIRREDAPLVYRFLSRAIAKKAGSDRVFDNLSSEDVNDYLRQIHPEMTSKDVRTWNANNMFLSYILEAPIEETTNVNRAINTTIDKVARRLQHTRDVCRKNYIHPDFVEFARMVIVQRGHPSISQALA